MTDRISFARSAEMAGREVSCRPLGHLFEQLRHKAVPPEALANGANVSVDHLLDKFERISWASFLAVMSNASRIWSEAELEEIGAAVHESPSFRPFSVMLRLLYSVPDVYRTIINIGQQMFTCVQATLEETDTNHLAIELRVQDGYAVCREFFILTKGSLAAGPRLLGLNSATIEMSEVSRGIHYDITYPAKAGALAWLRKAATWPFTAWAAAKELREAHDILQQRHLDLIEQMAARERTEAALRTSEQHLRQSEAQLRLTLENAPIGIAAVDLDERFLSVNQAFCSMLGYSTAELMQKRFTDVTHPDDLEESRMVVEQVIRGQVVNPQLQKRYIRKDGRVIEGMVRVGVIRDEEGQPVQLVAEVEDITDRKQAEENLAQERNLLRALMDNLPDYVYVKDARSQFITLNTHLLKAVGAPSMDRVVGRTDFDYFPAEIATQYFADDQQVMQSGAPLLNKVELMVDHQQQRKWLLTSKVPFHDPHGQLVGVVGMSRDITSLKQAEDRLAETTKTLQALIQASPLAIFSLDPDGRVINWNPASEQMFGWTESEVLGQLLPIIPADKKDEFESLRESVLGGNSFLGLEVRRLQKDGSPIDLNISVAPLYDAQGSIRGTMGIAADISAHKRLEEQLRQSQKMEAIGQLAGGIAHDFNNLLTGILGNISLLLGQSTTEEPGYPLMQEIEKAGMRAAELTSQLLGFSRQTILRLEAIDLRAIINETVTFLHRTINPAIRVQVENDPDLWAIRADQAQMNQVLMNMCLNARDAMAEGGVLRIETSNATLEEDDAASHQDARPGRYVRLRISDTGHGMSPEIRPKIFDPFFTTKALGKGTGLGLAMVFGIIKQHHGWIECSSEVDQGTRFDVFIPRSSEDAVEPVESPPPADQQGGTETILLVDDEAIIRNLGRTILQQFGYRVLLAENGAEALQVFRQRDEPIDLVILDLLMPEMSGQETLRQLVQVDPRVRVIYSSAHSTEQIATGEGKAVLGLVRKPYSPQELVRTVRMVLDKPRGDETSRKG